MSVDFHSQSYYGQLVEQNEGEVIRGQRKKGTRKSYTYATAYFSLKGVRYTIALTRVKVGETVDFVLKRLMRRLKTFGIQPSLLLLDKGFYTTPVMRYLIRRKTPFLIPAKKHGKKAKKGQEPTGMYLYEKEEPGWYRYTLNKNQSKHGKRRPLTIDIAVVRRRFFTKQGLRKELWLYASWNLKHRSMRWVVKTYKTRFGIESSYRQGNQSLVRTSTRKASLRLIFFWVSQLLRQVWVWFHDEVFSERRQGGRTLRLEKMRLETLCTWVKNTVEECYGLIKTASSEQNFAEVATHWRKKQCNSIAASVGT